MSQTMTPALLTVMVDRIRRAIDPQRIILFGSLARGDARPGSDVDLLIVAPSSEPRWSRAAPVYRLLAGLGVGKDVVWWTQSEIDEWCGVRAHFVNRVLADGKVLYEKSA